MEKEKISEQKTPIQSKRVKRRLSRKRKIQLGILLLVILAMWLGWRQLNAPVTGHTVVTGKTLKPKIIKPKATRPATNLDNPYFQIALPAGYSAQSASQTIPGLLYQQTIIKPSAYGSTIINIAVKNLPDGGLSGDTSYQLRLKSPTRYSLSQQTVNGESVIIASDSLSAAIVAFWVHGGILATVSVSSGLANPSSDGNSEQQKVLQPVLDAWDWK